MIWVCVCVFIHNERERERFIFRLIEELLKWLSIGIEKWVSDFKLFSNPQILFFFFFFFFLCSSPPHPYIPLHPPSTQNLLYLSHAVHPDDYGSDCVDDDCCLWRWHTSTSWHYFKSLFIEQGWSVCLMLWELWQWCYHHSWSQCSRIMFYFWLGINHRVCFDFTVCDLFHFCFVPSFWWLPLLFFIFHFQGFLFQRAFCFREWCFLQSHKSQFPLLPSSHSLLHSFLPSLLSIILEFSIQQSCFNWIWGFQWTQQPSLPLFFHHLVFNLSLHFSLFHPPCF